MFLNQNLSTSKLYTIKVQPGVHTKRRLVSSELKKIRCAHLAYNIYHCHFRIISSWRSMAMASWEEMLSLHQCWLNSYHFWKIPLISMALVSSPVTMLNFTWALWPWKRAMIKESHHLCDPGNDFLQRTSFLILLRWDSRMKLLFTHDKVRYRSSKFLFFASEVTCCLSSLSNLGKILANLTWQNLS